MQISNTRSTVSTLSRSALNTDLETVTCRFFRGRNIEYTESAAKQQLWGHDKVGPFIFW